MFALFYLHSSSQFMKQVLLHASDSSKKELAVLEQKIPETAQKAETQDEEMRQDELNHWRTLESQHVQRSETASRKAHQRTELGARGDIKSLMEIGGFEINETAARNNLKNQEEETIKQKYALFHYLKNGLLIKCSSATERRDIMKALAAAMKGEEPYITLYNDDGLILPYIPFCKLLGDDIPEGPFRIVLKSSTKTWVLASNTNPENFLFMTPNKKMHFCVYAQENGVIKNPIDGKDAYYDEKAKEISQTFSFNVDRVIYTFSEDELKKHGEDNLLFRLSHSDSIPVDKDTQGNIILNMPDMDSKTFKAAFKSVAHYIKTGKYIPSSNLSSEIAIGQYLSFDLFNVIAPLIIGYSEDKKQKPGCITADVVGRFFAMPTPDTFVTDSPLSTGTHYQGTDYTTFSKFRSLNPKLKKMQTPAVALKAFGLESDWDFELLNASMCNKTCSLEKFSSLKEFTSEEMSADPSACPSFLKTLPLSLKSLTLGKNEKKNLSFILEHLTNIDSQINLLQFSILYRSDLPVMDKSEIKRENSLVTNFLKNQHQLESLTMPGLDQLIEGLPKLTNLKFLKVKNIRLNYKGNSNIEIKAASFPKSLEVLDLGPNGWQSDQEYAEFLELDLPNLQSLALCFYSIKQKDIEYLVNLIKKFPNLKSFTLNRDSKEQTGWDTTDFQPILDIASLANITIDGKVYRSEDLP